MYHVQQLESSGQIWVSGRGILQFCSVELQCKCIIYQGEGSGACLAGVIGQGKGPGLFGVSAVSSCTRRLGGTDMLLLLLL